MDIFRSTHAYFFAHPARLVSWGFRISMVGMLFLCAGLAGRFFLIIMPDVSKTSGKALVKNLDALLPYLPTWWIPESWFGYFAALIIAVTGLIVYGAGKRLVALLGRQDVAAP